MVDSASESNAADVNIGQLVDQGEWGAYQKFIVALLSLAYLVDGIANQSLGLTVPALMKDWGLARDAFASVAGIGLIGLTLGAVIGGYMGDRVGRRPMLVGSVLLFGAMTMAAAHVDNVHQLFWLRFADGIGMGAMIPNGAAMISESTPGRHRAMGIAIAMVFIAVGSMSAGLMAAAILPLHGWRGTFTALGATGVAVAIILALALPESPMFLARKRGRTPALDAVMRRFGQPLPAGATVNDRAPTGHKAAGYGVLFTQGVAGSTIALWVAFFFCLLASYSVFSWVPAMLNQLGYPLSLASLGMTANGAGGIVGGVLSGWFISGFGSRATILWSCAGAAVAAITMGICISVGLTSLVVLFSLLAALGFFISNIHNGMYTLSAYLYPPEARSTGVGSAAAAGRVGAIASSWVGVAALSLGGGTAYFMVIAVSAILSFIGTALVKRHIPPVSAMA